MTIGLAFISEPQRGNPKKRIITIHIADTESQLVVAAEKLRGVEKIIKSVRGHVIIGQRHERDLAFVHQIRKMGMGNG